MKLIFFIAAVIAVLGESRGEECPGIEFVRNFDPKRFLGKWRAIETSGLEMACGAYEAFETDEQSTFKIHISPVKIDIVLRSNRGLDFSAGFTEESPIELMNKANLKIFATDYDNYAGIIECKNADGLFFVSTTIASRSGVLSDEIVQHLKGQLESHGVDTSRFKVIRQDTC